MKKNCNLKALYFNPSKYCNLKCSHCWLSPSWQKEKVYADDDLSFAEIENLFTDVKDMGCSFIKFTGGEPLIRPDIIDVFKLCHSMGLVVQIETNGTLLDSEIVGVLKDIYRSNKKTFISISIDGQAAAHDKRRGVPGAFNNSVRGLNLLREAGIPVQIIMSLAKDNIKDLDAMLVFGEEFNIHSLKINYINDIERGEALARSGILLSVEEILLVEKKLNDESFKRKYKIASNIPLSFRSIKNMKSGGHCGIFGIAGVLNNGDVSMCGVGKVSPDIIAGNIREKSFKEIWEKGGIFKSIRNEVPEQFTGVCSMCALKAYCLGSCRADSWYKHKNLTSPFHFCQEAYDLGLFPKRWLLKNKVTHGV